MNVKSKILIGIGKSGFEILKDFEKLGVNNQKLCLSEKVNSTSSIKVYGNIRELVETLNSEMEVFLLGGLGGTTSKLFLALLLDILSTKNVDFQGTFFLPFRFEGNKRRIIAKEIIFKASKYQSLRFLELSEITKNLRNEPISIAFFYCSEVVFDHFKN